MNDPFCKILVKAWLKSKNDVNRDQTSIFLYSESEITFESILWNCNEKYSKVLKKALCNIKDDHKDHSPQSHR